RALAATTVPNTMNGAALPIVVMVIAVIAGPPSVAAPSSQPIATFAAASSAGSRTADGISVAMVGRVVETAADANTAPPYTRLIGAPEARAMPAPSIPHACTDSPAMSTRRGA